MAAKIDLTGVRFGRLVILGRDSSRDGPYWTACCDCGVHCSKRGDHLRRGLVKSCGCIVRTKGGRSGERLCRIWRGMHARCGKPAHDKWARYGGRGIRVCAEWGTYEAFRAWALENGYQASLELDRINNDGPYEPSNCRFVTHTENMRKTSRTRFLVVDGKQVSLSGAAETSPVSATCIRSRLAKGATGEEAVAPKRTKYRFYGEDMTIAAAAAKYGILERTIRFRLKRGLTPEAAITRPVSRGVPF